MSVSTLRRIRSFVGVGMLRVLVYRLPILTTAVLQVQVLPCLLHFNREKPSRAQHVGVLTATNARRYRIGSMHVRGDNLAVATEDGLCISMWNWKSGEHISEFCVFFYSNEMISHSADHGTDDIAAGARPYLSR
jgi:hypothetical protein